MMKASCSMKLQVRVMCTLLAAAALADPVAGQGQAVAPAASPASAADQQLRALYDGFAAWEAKEFGYFENDRGETKPADYLARVDAASQMRRADYYRQTLAQLNALTATQLSAEEQVNAAIFRTLLENNVADARFREWEMPFNSDSNFWTYLDASRGLEDAAEYRRYIARMRQIPRYFDEQIANMRAGLARGFTVPRATLEGRDASIATFANAAGDKSGFYKAFATMPASIPAAEQEALRAEGRAAIEQAVRPAYARLVPRGNPPDRPQGGRADRR
jgi:uncharacterized protein (DUF885 family)